MHEAFIDKVAIQLLLTAIVMCGELDLIHPNGIVIKFSKIINFYRK